MGDKSAIEWTDATWNPATGCTKISPGCANCYIARTPPFRINRRRFEGGRGADDIGATTGVIIHADRLDQPVRWKRPRRIFVNSLSDLFHSEILGAKHIDRFGTSWPFIAEVFATMVRADHHTFQVLTKRPRVMATLLSHGAFRLEVNAILMRDGHPVMPGGSESPWPDHIWLGTSAEDQRWADQRIPALLQVPSRVRFVSAEPLLGPIEMAPEWLGDWPAWPAAGLAWVIVGGESGPGARPMHPAWARSLRDQCVAAGVPFHFKQWGEHQPVLLDGGGLDHDEVWAFRRAGKKAAGRELDGRTWDEMPRHAAERSAP